MKTPVAFLIFNRPDTTRQVFEAIRTAAPETLFLIADGPRSAHDPDVARCAEVRDIVSRIDWTPDVRRIYSDTNMGCGRRVSSGLDQVFEEVERAIVLEDDCLPDPTFFPFCEELLERYEDDERIMAISGDNFQMGRRRTQHSYYFSMYNHCWGWASWRRAWSHFDFEMAHWPEFRDGRWLEDLLRDTRQARYWRRVFEEAFAGAVDTWDFQWTFACWTQGGLTALPNRNLVSNIGFGEAATHTATDTGVAALPTGPIALPLDHPPFVVRDVRADEFTDSFHFALSRRLWLWRQLMRIPRKLAKTLPSTQAS